nr:hypothetical transcript [Hymenolepis microstoma]
MSLLELEKEAIRYALLSASQAEYEYIGETDTQFVIKRVFEQTLLYTFHIPFNYPISIPSFLYNGDHCSIESPVNSFPDTDKTLIRIFLRVIFLDYRLFNKPFPDCFKALDPIFHLYLLINYESSTK